MCCQCSQAKKKKIVSDYMGLQSRVGRGKIWGRAWFFFPFFFWGGGGRAEWYQVTN